MQLENCPHCQVQFDATGIPPGNKVRCGGCGEVITVAGGRPITPVPVRPVGRAPAPGTGGYRVPTEEIVSDGARGRYGRKKRLNPLPFVLGGLGGLVLLGVVLFLMFGGDSIDPDTATMDEKLSYVRAYGYAKRFMEKGKQLPTIPDAIAKTNENPNFTGRMSEEYFTAGWNDGVKRRDQQVTMDDLSEEYRRKFE